MKSFKSFFLGIGATLLAVIGLVILFFRRSPAKVESAPKAQELEKKADAIKEAIKQLEEEKKVPVEDKTLEQELDYWKKQ